jgi:hypothetical protein
MKSSCTLIRKNRGRRCFLANLISEKRKYANQFTSIIERPGKWYLACVEEIPGVNTQGRTPAEAAQSKRSANSGNRSESRPGEYASAWDEPKRSVATGSVDQKISPVQRKNCFDVLPMCKIYNHRIGELGPQACISIHDGLNSSCLRGRNGWYFQDSRAYGGQNLLDGPRGLA